MHGGASVGQVGTVLSRCKIAHVWLRKEAICLVEHISISYSHVARLAIDLVHVQNQKW
jgi:hypothetical protein